MGSGSNPMLQLGVSGRRLNLRYFPEVIWVGRAYPWDAMVFLYPSSSLPSAPAQVLA